MTAASLRRISVAPRRPLARDRPLHVACAAAGLFALALVGACAVDPNATGGATVLDLDFNDFACKVQRPMVRRCSMLACHGRADHALRVYSPGKLRLNPWTTLDGRNGAIALSEVQANYASAVGLTFGSSPQTVPLLRKTVPPDQGGGEHVGGVIFHTADDPDYQALAKWVGGEKLPGGCAFLTAIQMAGM